MHTLLVTMSCVAQIFLPAQAGSSDDAEAYAVLKNMTKRCLSVDPQGRVKAFTVAQQLFKAAQKAGWL